MLNCLNFTKQHGQKLPAPEGLRTQVSHDGHLYQYADEPEKVKSEWNAREDYAFDGFESDGVMYLTAEIHFNSEV